MLLLLLPLLLLLLVPLLRLLCRLGSLRLRLRCDWMSGCAELPVAYRADAVDGVAPSRLRAEWPGRAA